jgi:type I restriction enzyme S subunit
MTQNARANGWSRLPFDDCVLDVGTRRKSIPRNRYQKSGAYPVVDQGQDPIGGYTDDASVVYNDHLPLVLFGDHTRVFKFLDSPFAAGADGTKLFRANESRLTPLFLYYALRSLDIPERGYNRHYSLLREMQIAFPEDKTEQSAIANVLASIERAVEVQARNIAALKELKAATMAKLFREGMRDEPTKETQVGTIPASWDVVRLGEHCTMRSGGTPDRSVPQYWGADIPWVKTAEIDYCAITDTGERISRAGLENSNAKVFPPGTVLMAMYGQGVTRGRVAVLGIEATTNQACAAFFPDETIDSAFLYAYFCHAYESLRELGHGANQRNLSIDLLAAVHVPRPPERHEQLDIAATLTLLERRLNRAQLRMRGVEALFYSALRALTSGELRVTPLLET